MVVIKRGEFTYNGTLIKIIYLNTDIYMNCKKKQYPGNDCVKSRNSTI